MNLSQDFWSVSASQRQVAESVEVRPSRLLAVAARLGNYWVARRERAREARELQGFSDRELREIGIGRSDIRTVVNGTYRRD